jgi:hypothetical protein
MIRRLTGVAALTAALVAITGCAGRNAGADTSAVNRFFPSKTGAGRVQSHVGLSPAGTPTEPLDDPGNDRDMLPVLIEWHLESLRPLQRGCSCHACRSKTYVTSGAKKWPQHRQRCGETWRA